MKHVPGAQVAGNGWKVRRGFVNGLKNVGPAAMDGAGAFYLAGYF
jgi:hypothetical protein